MRGRIRPSIPVRSFSLALVSVTLAAAGAVSADPIVDGRYDPGEGYTFGRSVNFTVEPEDSQDTPRIYANFCAVQKSPFDFTLTFCEMPPFGAKEVQQARDNQVIKAPVRARMVVPVQMIPALIAALQENMRLYQESFGPPRGPLH